ncbi:uncharacterized protein DS421_14g468330 [Arachis hypogaea]|nr:uncharacterized protein DS421_14g468330 [Arachis hypogaea]
MLFWLFRYKDLNNQFRYGSSCISCIIPFFAISFSTLARLSLPFLTSILPH